MVENALKDYLFTDNLRFHNVQREFSHFKRFNFFIMWCMIKLFDGMLKLWNSFTQFAQVKTLSV